MGVRGGDEERESEERERTTGEIRRDNDGATIKLDQLAHMQRECDCFTGGEKKMQGRGV